MYDINKWNESEGNNRAEGQHEEKESPSEAMSRSQQPYSQAGQASGENQSQQPYSQTSQTAGENQSQQPYRQASQASGENQNQQPYSQAGRVAGENQSQQPYSQASQTAGEGQSQQTYNQEPRRQVYGQLGQGQPSYSQGGSYSQNGSNSQNNQYDQNARHGVYGQNGGSYSNPYQYQYYQTSGSSQNSGSGSRREPKKKSLLRTTAMVTAAAVLFGVVSGGTMFGVNRAAQLLFPVSSEEAAAQTQGALQSTTPIEATPQSSQKSESGVVIEDVSAIVEEVMPSVVAITNTTVYQGRTWFGQSQTYEIPSSGSGIIVGENETELLIVTNNHVIEDATTLMVAFIDETTAEAAIKGTDSDSDLAVIAVPLDEISADTKAQIKAATLGDSDALKMGQGVIAIGNALGLGQSVTVGHVSALNREITVDGVTKTVIQTDAAINPGNSGGALLNSKGEVIGINEAKYADTNVEGVGYAIPVSQAREIIEDLMNRTTKIAVDESEQGYLGVQLQNIDASMSQLYGMPEGVYVYRIVEDSAAAASDLREKDIITAMDGEKISNYADLTDLLTYYSAGTTVTLTVQRLENGEYVERQVEITLKNRPAETEQAPQQ